MGRNLITGTDGDDRLRGTVGNDKIYGLDGDDRISQGLGADLLFGGGGEDVFVFQTSDTGRDRVKDFEDGIDLLDLSAWDISYGQLKNNIVILKNGNTLIRGDDEGESFVLEGTFNLTKDDFIGV